MEQKTKICPYCGETILAVAKKCRYCGEWLDKGEKPSSTPTEETENPSVETNDTNQQQEPVSTTDDGHVAEQNHTAEETTTSTVVSKPKVTAITTPTSKPTLNKAKLFIAIGIVLVIAVIMLIFHATYEYTTYWQEESTCQAIISGVGLLLLVLYLVVFCRKDIDNMLSSHKHDSVPHHNTSSKTGSKKSLKALKWIVPIVVVLGFGGGGYAYYHHQKASKEATYLQNAQKVKADASTIVATADLILDDYYRNWRGAIYNRRAYNNYMEKVYCDDFNQAVNWRVEYYSDELSAMFSLLQSIQDHLQQMIDVPEKYASVDNSLKEVYGKAKELVSLCQYPEGNLATFSVKTQDAVNAVKKSLSDSDILIDASGTSSDKDIDRSRIYDAVSKSNELDK